MKTKEVRVVNLDGTDAPLELLAQDIERVARAGDAILNSRLTMRALQLLIQDASSPRVSLSDIDAVLKAIPGLRGALKQPKKAKQ